MRPLPLLATALALSGFATDAQAHTRVATSSPAANAAVPPTKSLSMTFSEKTVPAFSGADIFMSPAPEKPTSTPTKLTGTKAGWSNNAKTLTLTTARPLGKGMYRVMWHAAGADTHRMQGGYSFTVK